jgi:hypothetical protein
MIAGLVPTTALGNTLPAVLPEAACGSTSYRSDAPLRRGTLNALIFDFVVRHKVQGQHLNWYIVEQLPVVPPDHYDRRFGARTVAEIVREDVPDLTCTAHDMAAFAGDQGYDRPPFR